MANTTATTNINAKLDSLPKETSGDYAITGWYSDEEFNNNVTLETVFNSNTTLYAKWEEQIGFEVTFNAGGGTFTDGSTSIVMFTNADGTVNLPTDIPTKDGYVMIDWSTEQDVPSWNSNYPKVDETTVVTGNITVFAVWREAATITFKYCANNGIAELDGTEIGSIHVQKGIETSATVTPPVIEGYRFVGWYYDENYNDWSNAATSYTPWSDTTLYARYEPIS